MHMSHSQHAKYSHISIKCQANFKQTFEMLQDIKKRQSVNLVHFRKLFWANQLGYLKHNLVQGWRVVGYVATSHVDVEVNRR